MKNKILSMMDTTKKKVGVALLCGAIVTTLGAGTALAVNSGSPMLAKMENGVRIMKGTDSPLLLGKSIQSKVENGVRSYSTDDGKTWSEEAPEGVIVGEDKDGKFTVMNGLPPEGAKGMSSMMVKMENGVRSYSTDDGKTWSLNCLLHCSSWD